LAQCRHKSSCGVGWQRGWPVTDQRSDVASRFGQQDLLPLHTHLTADHGQPLSLSDHQLAALMDKILREASRPTCRPGFHPRDQSQDRPCAGGPNSAIRKGSRPPIEARRPKGGGNAEPVGQLTSCGSAMSRCRHNVQTKRRNASNKSAMYGMNLVLQYLSVTAVLLLIPRSPAPRP